LRDYRQGGLVPSSHTTTVSESRGTTTVVSFSGGGGLLLLMQPPSMHVARIKLDTVFIIPSDCPTISCGDA